MRHLFALLFLGCSTETTNPSGCPGHIPAQGDRCDTTLTCQYFVGVVGCGELPIFDCVDGGWTLRHFTAVATCPGELPSTSSTNRCPDNLPCVNNVRTLVCNYGCIRAQCTPGSSWILRATCDGGVDAAIDARDE